MPKNKGKGRRAQAKPKTRVVMTEVQSDTPPSNLCQTLEEDEMTRCSQVATHGYPTPTRCTVHHGQYITMTKSYKDASRIVDEILGGHIIPTQEEIQNLKSYEECLEKARWVRKYVEAVRKERTGREIHHRRFFLKVDDGHKLRMKKLAKAMTSTIEVFNALQSRALELYMADNPNYEWFNEDQDPLPDMPTVQSATNLQEMIAQLWTQRAEKRTHERADDDLVEMRLQGFREVLLFALDKFLDRFNLEDKEAEKALDPFIQSSVRRERDIGRILMRQFARRIIFYDPILFSKATDKVSFEDLFSHPDFTLDDVFRFEHLYSKRLGFGLLWFRDSLMEACAMAPSLDGKDGTNLANFGNYGGWIYNRRHETTVTNEVWSLLLEILDALEPTGALPANIEHRFVRLCNTFDDLCSFLAFAAFGQMKSPSWCPPECQVYRNHLSLSEVVVADMVSAPTVELLRYPVPTKRPAKHPGMISYAEFEIRSFMFGAIRNESDPFADAFLQELRARPDLFCVITRSDTDPGQKVETFGGLEESSLPHLRIRSFDSPPGRVPMNRGKWEQYHSAFDILYSTGTCANGQIQSPKGYLANAQHTGFFFRFKKFPVKYFVIIDVHPGRAVRHLARGVIWAALRAQGLAEGEFSIRKYARASDRLFHKRANERLSWMPSSRWKAGSMEEELPPDLEPEHLAESYNNSSVLSLANSGGESNQQSTSFDLSQQLLNNPGHISPKLRGISSSPKMNSPSGQSDNLNFVTSPSHSSSRVSMDPMSATSTLLSSPPVLSEEFSASMSSISDDETILSPPEALDTEPRKGWCSIQ
ncbi:hypothetical protein K435DRAFT_845454 [Dendrothele bispora CBS 962.96]|uniref:Uncharacterized protein n=1 Tax=Dendrothele bispora (strain CBS 962.96) TaxID=1314807 RepID=A0A4S8KUB1_DENBC|nr:hypothetical protein K435DRAFT_845454 [Dendrothele bispora CBS 962.96]